MRLKNLKLTLRYEDDVRLFPSRMSRLAYSVGVVLLFVVPLSLKGDFWLSVGVYAGILAIGALGLNLLTGFTGQVSLGHAFFIGVGAYCAVFFGSHHNMSMPVWLLSA